MLKSSDSFIAVEYCHGIEVEHCDEIAIVVFGTNPDIHPKLHKLTGWPKIAAHLPVEELDFISNALHEIVNRIRFSRGNLLNLQSFENAIRIRGPFSVDLYYANYKSRILS